ncbi:OB-fold domain-containing protein [Arthrobacter sp. Rue61a]|uniref:Zn-ribbon domain-containing OB-fold protein n=1 Tax=Arthrobacter sp. Rue61a TaxID=1118963 RepID=UPI0002D6C6E1|nr:OB-fold domain-containing protein [Arthrobacter sp. Rue61a]
MSTQIERDGQAITVVAGEYFTEEADGAHLRITHCHACESRWFPPVSICSRCAGTDLADVASGTTGVTYASTVVRVGPREFPAPYVLSYVDIDGVRILAHTESGDALVPGTPVELAVGQIGESEGTPLISYVAHPAAGRAESEGERK